MSLFVFWCFFFFFVRFVWCVLGNSKKIAEEDSWEHQQQVGSCDEEWKVLSRLQDCSQNPKKLKRLKIYIYFSFYKLNWFYLMCTRIWFVNWSKEGNFSVVCVNLSVDSAGKLILISNNCPPLRKSEIEYYAMLAKVGVHHYNGSKH